MDQGEFLLGGESAPPDQVLEMAQVPVVFRFLKSEREWNWSRFDLLKSERARHWSRFWSSGEDVASDFNLVKNVIIVSRSPRSPRAPGNSDYVLDKNEIGGGILAAAIPRGEDQHLL